MWQSLIQHLRDIGSGSESESESDDGDAPMLNQNNDANILNEDVGPILSSFHWTWDLALPDRWKAISEFLRIVSTAVSKLSQLADG